MSTRALVLTPHGRLHLEIAEDAPSLPDDLSQRLEQAFERGEGDGLVQLGAGEIKTELPPTLVYCVRNLQAPSILWSNCCKAGFLRP